MDLQHEIIQKIHELNKESIGWNVYDTDDGPQPNLYGKVTYTRDAFWVEKVTGGTIKELLSLLGNSPNDFCVVHGGEQDKFTIFYLPPFFIESKVLIQRVKVQQLDDEGLRLLQEEVQSEKNRARADHYREATVEIPENLYGQGLRHKDGKKSLVKFGTKTLEWTEQVPVPPFYD